MQEYDGKAHSTISSTQPSQNHDCITLQVKSSESGSDIDVIITAKTSVLKDAFPESTDALNNSLTHWEASNGYIIGFSLKENCGLISAKVFQRLTEQRFSMSSSHAVAQSTGSLTQVYLLSRA